MPTAASGFAGQKPIVFNLVYVNEVEASAGSSPQEWLLQISSAVTDFSEARAVAHRCPLRWRIEGWHRILKSDCKVEFLQCRKGERIEHAVTINEVITWRAGSYDPAWQGNSRFADASAVQRHRNWSVEGFRTRKLLESAGNVGAGVVTMAIA